MTKQDLLLKIGRLCVERERLDRRYRDIVNETMKRYPRYHQRQHGTAGYRWKVRQTSSIRHKITAINRQLSGYIFMYTVKESL